MELCTHEKAVFFFPVNILMVWSPAFLAARHTTVCLDHGVVAGFLGRNTLPCVLMKSSLMGLNYSLIKQSLN